MRVKIPKSLCNYLRAVDESRLTYAPITLEEAIDSVKSELIFKGPYGEIILEPIDDKLLCKEIMTPSFSYDKNIEIGIYKKGEK